MDTFIYNPMINALLLLYDFLGNFVLAIAVFTILIRLLTLPLNLRQQRSSMRMAEMQPQIQAIQKKYRDNPQRMNEEFRRIGYDPKETLSGCLPLLIQFPILIGLYRSIIVVLGSTPQALFELTQRAYDHILIFPGVDLAKLLPVPSSFLWLDLGKPDPLLILPVLVFISTFAQQKLLSPASRAKNKDGKQDDNPAAAMTQSMQYTMPIMFGFISLQFQAGLSIYFILSNLIGIAQGYYVRNVIPTPGPKREAIQEGDAASAASSQASQVAAAKPGSSKAQPYKAKRPSSKRKRRSAKR